MWLLLISLHTNTKKNNGSVLQGILPRGKIGKKKKKKKEEAALATLNQQDNVT